MPDLTARKELSRLFEHHDRGYSSSAEWRTALLDAIEQSFQLRIQIRCQRIVLLIPTLQLGGIDRILTHE